MTGLIRFIEETGSTNADVAAALRSNEPPAEGDWLVTRRQTAGRGRQGREWFDGAGNFMGSCVVELRVGDPPPASLSFVAAIAVAQAIQESLGGACEPALKWPNDVLLDGGKASGILLEMVGRSVVVGIGVNLLQAPELPDRKTATLTQFGSSPTPEEFARTLAEKFAAQLSAWRNRGLDPILKTFLINSSHSLGSPVSVHDPDGSRIEGTFAGLEETDGALRLRLADGFERVIRAGDIS